MQAVRNILKRVIKGYLRDAYWSVYGRQFFTANLPSHADTFLFLCKGNICRSAFAHYMAEKIDQEKAHTFVSAGIEVSQSEPSPKDAIIAAEAFGISLHRHGSIPINGAHCRNADMILVMEVRQLARMRRDFPQFQDRVFLLSQFESDPDHQLNGWHRYNIADPYGQGDAAFRQCFERIERCLHGLLAQAGDPNWNASRMRS